MDDERVVIGLMSGTSADGIDAVAVFLAGDDPPSLRVGRLCKLPFDEAFRARVLAAPDARAPELALLHVELGRRFGDAARAAMGAEGLSPGDVHAVACAGVTVVHLPPDPDARGPDAEGATLALGDGDVIAERSGCRVVSDLRARDRAAGGQGAPLVPFADRLLLHDATRIRAALNLGGIANLTVVPPEGDVIAFDTGPGNMLMDGALAHLSGGSRRFDDGGALALAGRIDEGWLAALLAADGFLRLSPPKSTGRERYGRAWIEAHATDLAARELPDVLATLAAYTVRTVAEALQRWAPPAHPSESLASSRPADLVVSGGGALNHALMRGLRQALPDIDVTDSETTLGLPVLAKEAVAFALLADATLAGVPSALPSVTGARRAAVLGKISPAP